MTINEQNYAYGASKSSIREIAAYGSARKAQIGAENVFDFSLGNPSIPAPDAVRESIELFKHVADVNIKALFVSVDRMERGTRECSTLDELRQDYGIQVFPIVTVREVIAFLHNNSIDGKVYIDDEMKAKMEAYLEEYGAKG